MPPDPDDFRPVELSELRAAAARDKPHVRPLPPPQTPPAAPVAPRAPWKRGLGVAVAGGLAAAGALLVAAWIGFGRDGGEDQADQNSAGSQPAGGERAARNETAHGTVDEGTSTTAVREQSPKSSPAAAPAPIIAKSPPAPDPGAALYAVLVGDDAGQGRFRLGTAWAVGAHRLVTSGAIVMALDELQNSGMTAVLVAVGAPKEIPVTGMHVHPEYRRACQQAAAARLELDTSSPAKDQSQTKSDSGTSRSAALRTIGEDLDRAFAAQAACDVGLLEVRERLMSILTPAFEAPLLSSAQVMLAGLPFPVDQHRMADPGSAARVEKVRCHITQHSDGEGGVPRVTVAYGGELARLNWSGSPVLNADQRVVAVYSRPLLDFDDETNGDRDQPLSHAVTPVARLREMGVELK